MTRKKDGEELDAPSYDDFPDSRLVFLFGSITEKSVRDTITRLFLLSEQSLTPIKLIVSTYGGSVDEAIALHDAIKLCPAPVHTLGIGKIMSAGCLVLASGHHGERAMTRNSRLMYHAGYDSAHGDVLDHQIALVEFKRTEKVFDQLVADALSRTVDDVQSIYKDRIDVYMTAKKAKQWGFIDKVL